MDNQELVLNDVQRALCTKFSLHAQAGGEGFVVIDRDPALRAKKVKLPRYEGSDLNALIFEAKNAQEARHGNDATVAPEPEVVVEDESVVEESEEESVEDAHADNVVPLRRVVISETEAPTLLTDVVLDNSGKKTKKIKVEKKHRDNRYARAFRALLENPEASVEEQASIADVSVDMFKWYHITFRHVDRILREKYGEECIPVLPDLND